MCAGFISLLDVSTSKSPMSTREKHSFQESRDLVIHFRLSSMKKLLWSIFQALKAKLIVPKLLMVAVRIEKWGKGCPWSTHPSLLECSYEGSLAACRRVLPWSIRSHDADTVRWSSKHYVCLEVFSGKIDVRLSVKNQIGADFKLNSPCWDEQTCNEIFHR